MEVKWMRSWDMGTGEPWEWRGRGIAQVERRKWDWGQREGWWSKNCEGRCGTRGVGHVMCNGGLTGSQQDYNCILEETWLPSACIHFNHGNDRKSEGEPSLLTNDLLSYTMHFLWSSVLIISSSSWKCSQERNRLWGCFLWCDNYWRSVGCSVKTLFQLKNKAASPRTPLGYI